MPWKIDARMQYLMTKTSTEGFSLSSVASALQSVITGYTGAGPALGLVPLVNLCPACWGKQANVWIVGAGAGVYAAIPAKTADTGVYFNNSLADYDSGGKPDLEKVRSTCVHEMMHYWSHNHEGLQPYEQGKNVHWDECVTDFLARKVYFAITSREAYKTSYGTMSEFIKRQLDQIFQKALPKFKLRALQAVNTAPFAKAFNDLAPTGFLKPNYRNEFEKALGKSFITWYMNGPNTIVDGLTIGTFLSSDLGQFVFQGLNDASVGYGTPTVLHSA
ncbi:MAG TPA: hypothetical protein VF283_18475 [Bryobacteraceae bacterium]